MASCRAAGGWASRYFSELRIKLRYVISVLQLVVSIRRRTSPARIDTPANFFRAANSGRMKNEAIQALMALMVLIRHGIDEEDLPDDHDRARTSRGVPDSPLSC